MSFESPDVRTQTRTVSVEHLDELYAKADSLNTVRRWLDAAGRVGATAQEASAIAGVLDRKYGPLR